MIIIGKIILVFVLVIAASIIANIIINKLNEGGDSTSMAAYIECLKTPIITVHNNNKILNFIVDTGANYSLITKTGLQNLKYTVSEKTGTMYGITGETTEVSYINMSFTFNKKKLEENFQVAEISALESFKKTYGIEVTGILGNTFLQKYKFIIDYKNLNIRYK